MRLYGKAKMLLKASLISSTFFLFLMSGCAKHPSESQLDELARQKKAALAAEQKVQERRAEKEKLQKTLKEKRSELRELERERDAIKSRL